MCPVCTTIEWSDSQLTNRTGDMGDSPTNSATLSMLISVATSTKRWSSRKTALLTDAAKILCDKSAAGASARDFVGLQRGCYLVLFKCVVVVEDVGMWKSLRDFQGRSEGWKTCFWFSRLSTGRHFHITRRRVPVSLVDGTFSIVCASIEH